MSAVGRMLPREAGGVNVGFWTTGDVRGDLVDLGQAVPQSPSKQRWTS